MKYFLLFILFTNFAFSQEIVWTKQLHPSLQKINQIRQLDNPEFQERVFCFFNKDNAFAYVLDADFKLKDSLNLFLQNKRLEQYIGGVVEEHTYKFLFLEKKEIKTVLFDFSNRKLSIQLSEFLIDKKHEILQYFEHKNQLFVVSLSKKENVLHFYNVSNAEEPKRYVVDLNTTNFRNWHGRVSTLYAMIKSPSNFFKPSHLSSAVQKVNSELHNDLSRVNSMSKIYVDTNTFTLSLDANSNFTQLITINLNNWTSQVLAFPKPSVQAAPEEKNSNSFLFNNYLFNIVATNDVLKMNMITYPNKIIKQSYSFEKTDTLDIRNTGFIVENGAYTSYRELNNFKSFLRKISSDYLGIVVGFNAENYEIMLGSTTPYYEGWTFFPIGMPMTPGGMAPIMMMPVSGGVRDAYTSSLLDQDFKNVDGSIKTSFLKKTNDFNYAKGLKGLLITEKIEDDIPDGQVKTSSFISKNKVYKNFYLKKTNTFIVVEFKK